MKKLTLLLITFGMMLGVVGQNASRAQGPTTLMDGLVAHWEMEENSGIRYDSNNNTYPLTDHNGVGYEPVGVVGGAADFVATNGEYLTGDTSLFNPTADFTIGMWIKINSNTGSPQTLISKWSGGNYQYRINYISSEFRFYVSGNGSGETFVSSTTISLNTWYYLVVWYDNGGEIYLSLNNATPASNAAVVGGIYSSSINNLYIGRLNSSASYVLNGNVDSVSLWDRTLSAEERSALYNNGNGLDWNLYDLYPPTPTPSPTATNTPTSTATPTNTATPTATPTNTPISVPVNCVQYGIARDLWNPTSVWTLRTNNKASVPQLVTDISINWLNAGVDLLEVQYKNQTLVSGNVSPPYSLGFNQTVPVGNNPDLIYLTFDADPGGLGVSQTNCQSVTVTPSPTPANTPTSTSTVTPTPTTDPATPTPLPTASNACAISYTSQRDINNSPDGWIVTLRSDDVVDLAQIRLDWGSDVLLLSALYAGQTVFSGSSMRPAVIAVNDVFSGTRKLTLDFSGNADDVAGSSQDCALIATATPSPTSIFPSTPTPTVTASPTPTLPPGTTPTPDLTATALAWGPNDRTEVVTNSAFISVTIPTLETGDLYDGLVSGASDVLQPLEDFGNGVAGLVSDDPVTSANSIVSSAALLWSYLGYFSVLMPGLLSFSALILYYFIVMLIKVIISTIRYLKQIIPALG